MDDDQSRSLVEQASQGVATARDQLLERHLPGLLAYVRLHAGPLVLDRESCSDLAQSVCREVLEQLGEFEYRGEAPFRKWLFANAASKIVDRQRYYLAEKRHPAREDRASSELDALAAVLQRPSEAAVRAEDLALLERAFRQLSEEHREIITLVRIVGMSHKEAAAELDSNEVATRALLRRALVRVGILMNRSAD